MHHRAIPHASPPSSFGCRVLQMRAAFLSAFALAVCVLCGGASAGASVGGAAGSAATPWKHVVVLMMENHSFDNMLGWLPGIGDLDGSEYNHLKPSDPTSAKVFVGKNASYCTFPDPDHSFHGTGTQMFAPNAAPESGLSGVTMDGFVESFVGDKGAAADIMQCYTPEQVPVISTLATSFRTLTRYHASVPGPTGPNRMFMHAATSTGYNGGVYNGYGYPINATTIYEHIQEQGLSWALHFHDFTTAHGIYPLNTYTAGFVQDDHFDRFFADIDAGSVKNYTFLVPLLSPWDFNGTLDTAVNTEHPFTDIRLGEQLLKRVYEKLRSSAYWDNTLLVINYDEHGGFWDKQTPAATVNPTPALPSHPTPFAFDRLGVRVPAILVSPWLAASTDDTVYDHTSVLATVKSIFGLPTFLTARDAVASTMNRGILSAPRTDTPLTLPDPPTSPPLCMLTHPDGGANDLAREYAHMYQALLNNAGIALDGGLLADNIASDYDAGVFNRAAIKRLFGPPAPAPAAPADPEESE